MPGGAAGTGGQIVVAYDLGIDVGTSFTAAAAAVDGVAEVLSLGAIGDSVPTALYLKGNGQEIVGEAANRRGLTDPTHISREFKRRLGDPQPIMIGGAPYSAQALMAKMLKWVVGQATERMGQPPTRVVGTHPANWGPYKLELFDQALQLADLDGAAAISEPHAAAISYASRERIPDGSVVAVYDLGGGTFDAAVLRKQGHLFELMGQSVGVEHLGGIDFDQAVINHVIGSLGDSWPADQLDDPAILPALANLRRNCIGAKEVLSTEEAATVPVLLPEVNQDVTITRAAFEQSIRNRIQESVHSLRVAINGARVTPDDVSVILLVGGSSRIPLVRQLVAAELGRPVAVDADPKFPVARGAALAAAHLGGATTAAPTEPARVIPITPTGSAEPAGVTTPAPPGAGAEPPAASPPAASPTTTNPPSTPTAPIEPPSAPEERPTGHPTPEPTPVHSATEEVAVAADSPKRPSNLPIIAAAVAIVAIVAVVAVVVANRDGGEVLTEAAGEGTIVSGTASQESTSTVPPPALPSGVDMAPTEAGDYNLGINGDPARYAAERVVTLAPFFIDQFEVTNEQFAAFVTATGSATPADWTQGQPPTDQLDHPVDGVAVGAADGYCAALGKRLPTEAEWEATARGLGGSLYPWGDDPAVANLLPSSGTYPVGSIPENVSANGVFDLSGNVWEWVGDPYEPIPDGQRVLRGGANGLVRDGAARLVADPATPTIVATAGFRCVATEVDPAAPAGEFRADAAAVLPPDVGEQAPQNLGAILFTDDFTDPDSGWKDQETDTQVSGYHAPDFFHLEQSVANSWMVSTRGLDYSDVSVTSSALVEKFGTEEGLFRYGIVVRYSGEGFLAFTLNPRLEEWAVIRGEADDDGGFAFTQLTSGTDPTIKGFGAKDTLRVDMTGGTFDFFVNDRRLTRLDAPAEARGDVGFFVETFDEPLAHVHYDELIVRELT